jgi:hypothetical protein
MKMAAMTVEARMMARAATALATIALVSLAITHFVTRSIFANAIACCP